ncbi:transposase, partial [Streptomyces sp. NPDC056231]|uniref:transposase n=1 Tax=Streptomyces sp. NPDC056231 TaxID=3345755 RepID=UPI003AAFBAAD
MKKSIGSYPRVRVEGGGRGAVSQAGAALLVETVHKSGLDTAISAALAPWRRTRAVHDPGKILLDVALAVALGGDGTVTLAWPSEMIFGSSWEGLLVDTAPSYKGHRYPVEIISHCVWLYFRFPLSY